MCVSKLCGVFTCQSVEITSEIHCKKTLHGHGTCYC